MTTRRILSVILLLVAVAMSAGAQEKLFTYKIQGVVADSLTNEGEPYATLSISKKGAGEKPVKMAVTDSKGKFSVQASGSGDYTLTVKSVGRKEIRRDFTVSASTKTIDLGRLLTQDDKTELKEAEVVALKPLVKADIDKLTYSVEDDPEQTTNTVIEMLRKVPMVTVDGQDNIKVNGSSSFKIYVNDKPNNMMTNNPKEVLKSMPASSIKKIEVITNPGPKYDAEGVGGILNIITTGGGPEGYTATFSTRASNRGLGAGAFATVKTGKLTVSGNLNVNYAYNTKSYYDEHQTVTDDEGNALRQTELEGKQKGNGKWLGGSVEASYEIDTLRLLTASLSMSKGANEGNRSRHSYSFQPSTGSTLYSYLYGYDYRSEFNDISASVDYQRSFKTKGRMLTLSYRLESSPAYNYNTQLYSDMQALEEWQSLISKLQSYRFDGDHSTTEHTFQIDYTTPFAQHHTLETGLKYILRRNKANNDRYNLPDGEGGEEAFDNDYSTHYLHQNDIFAAYLGYGLSLKKWSARLGLRYEHTLQDVEYRLGRGSDFTKNFDDLVPSAKLGYKITDTQNISLSYKMRISRPGIWSLNPYLDDSNPVSISQGNPNLVSEKNHSLTIQYGSYATKLTWNLSLGYSFTNNSIESVSLMMKDTEIEGVLKPTGQQVMYETYRNIGSNRHFDFTGFINWNIFKNTRLFGNVWGAWVRISDGQSLSNHGWSVSMYGGVEQTIAKTWTAQLNCYRQTPGVTLQGNYGDFTSYTLSVSKKMLDKRLTITASASNFLKKYCTFHNNSSGRNFISSNDSRWENWSVSIGASYRIGKLQTGVKKASRTVQNDDVKQQKSGTGS